MRRALMWLVAESFGISAHTVLQSKLTTEQHPVKPQLRGFRAPTRNDSYHIADYGNVYTYRLSELKLRSC